MRSQHSCSSAVISMPGIRQRRSGVTSQATIRTKVANRARHICERSDGRAEASKQQESEIENGNHFSYALGKLGTGNPKHIQGFLHRRVAAMKKSERRQHGISRRQFIAAAAGAAVVVVKATGQQQATPSELRLINGSIHTMDAKNTIARAVVIRDGRFVSVGQTAPAAAQGSRTIDLGGR